MLYWAFIGTIYLLRLTWEDIKHKMWVDDRYNYFMMGLTVSLFSHYKHPIWYYLTLILLISGLSWLINKRNAIGEADQKTIMWTFTGFAIINPVLVVVYFVQLLVYLAFQHGVLELNKRFAKGSNKYFPAYPAFLLAFIMTCIFWRGLF